MAGKHVYDALRIADPERGRRLRLILTALFPHKSNIAIGQELGYDESSVRVWTKTGVISTALLKHLLKYGVSARYILTGAGDIWKESKPVVRPVHRQALHLSLSVQETAVRIARYLAGDALDLDLAEVQSMRLAANELASLIQVLLAEKSESPNRE